VRGSGGDVGITPTTKDSKMVISGGMTMKSVVWGTEGKGGGGMTIEKIGGGVEGLNPVRWWEVGLKEKGTNDVVYGVEDALNLAILLRGVGARHAEVDAVGEKEGTSGRIVKFSTVITLETYNGGAKLVAMKAKK
jgi:hypothetical protein